MSEHEAIGQRDGFAGEPPAVPVDHAHKRVTCLMCEKPLRAGDRKVHRGRCARMRETQLQRRRRAQKAL